MRAAIASFAVGAAACGPNRTPTGERPPVELECLPDLDGAIELAELPLATGARGTYWISPVDTAIDLAGSPIAGGRRWDWSAVASSDELVEVQTEGLATAWFAASFPSAELVAPLDIGRTIVGVLARESQSIALLGLASRTPDPPQGKTLVVYDQPIPLYVFPITAGATWTSVGTISSGHGTVEGLPFVGTHRYEVAVGASGELDLPDVTFTQAHRIDTRIAIQPSSGPGATRRSTSFVFECFGEVARATSRDDEPEREFRVAREVRRLGIQ